MVFALPRFLAAALTGILHGKSASYLSPPMPNTFSMAPRYVRDVRRPNRVRARRSATSSTASLPKLKRLGRQAPPSAPGGIALLGDARDVGTQGFEEPPVLRPPPTGRGWAVASPPYLRVVKYGYYNWLRTWLLGFDAKAIDAALDYADHRKPYLAFLREVLGWPSWPALTDDAIVVLVIGDVEFDRGRR